MRPMQVKQLDYDLTPTAGLALVGHHLKTLAPVLAEVDAALPVRTGVASSHILRSYLGPLICEHLNGTIGLNLQPFRSDEIRGQASVDVNERQQRRGRLAAQLNLTADAQVHRGEARNDNCLDVVRQIERSPDP